MWFKVRPRNYDFEVQKYDDRKSRTLWFKIRPKNMTLRFKNTTTAKVELCGSKIRRPTHVHLAEQVEGSGLLDEVLHLSGRRQRDLERRRSGKELF
jgi:hypothetical protein